MKKTKIRLRHNFYGCDTGCCGTEAIDEEEDRIAWSWQEPYQESAYEFVATNMRDLFRDYKSFEFEDEFAWCFRGRKQ